MIHLGLLLNGYLKKYNEQILESKKAEAALDPKRVTEDSSGGEGLSLTTVEDTKKQVREEGRETIPKSAKDLEIFSEMNQQTLSFYSVIYRDVRTIVIRNEKASLEIGEMMQHLEEQLSELAYFKNNINQLEPILKKIRVDASKKGY